MAERAKAMEFLTRSRHKRHFATVITLSINSLRSFILFSSIYVFRRLSAIRGTSYDKKRGRKGHKITTELGK